MENNKLPAALSWVERFVRYENNPVLRPQGRGFAADLIFNPGAIVKDDTVMLLCRGVDFRVSRQATSTGAFPLSAGRGAKTDSTSPSIRSRFRSLRQVPTLRIRAALKIRAS